MALGMSLHTEQFSFYCVFCLDLIVLKVQKLCAVCALCFYVYLKLLFPMSSCEHLITSA